MTKNKSPLCEKAQQKALEAFEIISDIHADERADAIKEIVRMLYADLDKEIKTLKGLKRVSVSENRLYYTNTIDIYQHGKSKLEALLK